MLVRSEAGEKIVDEVSKAGVISAKEFPAEREAILREAVGNKKKRVIERLAERGSESAPLHYLKIDDEHRRSFMEGGPQ